MAFPSFRGASRRLSLALALSYALALAGPASAQDIDIDIDIDMPDITIPDLDPATPALPKTKGALVFHGNYCGPGSRGHGRPPVDALDAACMHHDACSPAAGRGLPRCGCNARLAREAGRVARNPRADEEQRVAAEFVAAGAKVLACR